MSWLSAPAPIALRAWLKSWCCHCRVCGPDGSDLRAIDGFDMRRFLRALFWTLLGLVALGAGLFGYFVYTPTPEVPHLSGKFAAGTIESGGHTRTYLLYLPQNLPNGAPLVIVLHGSG